MNDKWTLYARYSFLLCGMSPLKYHLIAVFLLFSMLVQAQLPNPDSLIRATQRLNTKGMLVLGSWSAANLATGIYGNLNTTGQAKYFHQMNWMWNTVNAGLAAYSLVKSRQKIDSLGMDHARAMNSKFQSLYLFNAGLDVVYMLGGTGLLIASQNATLRKDQFAGYGKSILMQGGFLFLFDAAMFVFHKRQTLPKVKPIPNGIGLVF